MSTWKEWTLGNALRMTRPFKARSTREAWAKGCAIINAAFPSEKGRLVYLTLHQRAEPRFVTSYVRKQMKLSPEKRYFSNLKTDSRTDTVVAFGLSKEKLVPHRG